MKKVSLKLLLLGTIIQLISSFQVFTVNSWGSSYNRRNRGILMKQRHPVPRTKGTINIILARDFEQLGKKDDRLSVRGGYFMNFLLPRAIAYRASEAGPVKIPKNITTTPKAPKDSVVIPTAIPVKCD